MEIIRNLPIFHGTDARVFFMDDDVRIQFKRDIVELIDYMTPFFQEYYKPCLMAGERDRMEDIRERLAVNGPEYLYNDLHDALNHNNARLQGLLSWQYQENLMYFTQDYKAAVNYAYRQPVMGELGTIATGILLAAEKLDFPGWNPDEKQRKTICRIKELYFGEHYPIILVYDKYRIEDLQSDSGAPLDEYDIEGSSIIVCHADDVRYNFGDILFLRPGNRAELGKAARQTAKAVMK